MWEGRSDIAYPRFPGHEVSGTVERVGADVTAFREGDAVAAWVTERGFAEYVVVRADYCFAAGDVPLDLALAEPLACAVNAVERAAPALGDDVVIIGAGFMGNLVQMLVQLKGARSGTVSDTRPEALERARRPGDPTPPSAPAPSAPPAPSTCAASRSPTPSARSPTRRAQTSASRSPACSR